MVDQLAHIEARLQKVDSIPGKIDFLNSCAYDIRVESPSLALSLARRALDLAEESTGSPLHMAVSRQIEGYCLMKMRQFEEARDIVKDTLPVFEEYRDLRNYSYSLLLMGNIALTLNIPDEALMYYLRTAEIARSAGDDHRRAAAYAQIGKLYWRTSTYQTALEYLQRSLALYEQLHALPSTADTYNNIGLIYMGTKDYRKALHHYRKALELYHSLDDARGEANALGNIGTAYEQLGHIRKALRYGHKGLALRRRLKDREGEANSLNSIGKIYMDLGDYLRSQKYFLRSLSIYEDTDNKHGQSPALNNIGRIYWMLGDHKLASEYFHRSLKLHEETGDRQGQAISLGNIANAYLQWQDYNKALEYLFDSIEIFNDIGDQGGASQSLNLVGSTYASMGDFEQAREYTIRSITMVQELGLKYQEAEFMITLGRLYTGQYQLDEAIAAFRTALAIADSMQARQLSYTIHRELADVYARSNNYEAAYLHFTTFHEIEDEVSNKEVEKKIKAVEVYYDVQRTKRQNTTYRQKNTELSRLLKEVADLNAHLQSLNEEKNELLGIVAHDLQNPLCSILIIGKLLRDDPALSLDERGEFIESIINTVSHMSELISRLLSINALEQGRFNLLIAPFDLSAVASLVTTNYQNIARKKNIKLHLEQGSNCTANIDKNAMIQIVDNLVSNAIKFSPPDKNIYISTQRTENGIRCTVRDEGPGLTAEDRTKLFGKFSRLSARPTGGEHSTGLGLSVVKKLVEAMGGRVWCESEPGNGASFILSVPASRDEEV